MEKKTKYTQNNKNISFSITKFKLKIWGLKDLAFVLFMMVLLFFFDILNGVWGFIINVLLVALVLGLIDKSIEKEVNDWLASAKFKININVEETKQ